MAEVFNGPWYVSSHTSLKGHPVLSRGEIVLHTSGNIILNCPACGAMQFSISKVYNQRSKPTLSKPVLCGAGTCRRCAALFTIESGNTVILKPSASAQNERPKLELSQSLQDAGVAPPVDLDERIKEVKKRFRNGG